MQTNLTILFFLFFAITINAQSNISQDEKAVRGLVQNTFDEIWSKLDTTQILDFHTKDYLLLENGEVWRNKEVINYMTNTLSKPLQPIRKNRFEFIKFEQKGKRAWIAYHNFANWTLDGKPAGKAQWLESAVVVKKKKKWKMKMLHSTFVPEKKQTEN